MRWLVQILMFGLFAAVVGTLSVWPSYQLVSDEEAIVSLFFTHAGQRIGECRQISQEEMDTLPPNMRKPADCPRERHPLRVVLRRDDVLLYDQTLLPSGIWSDGKANVYRRIPMSAGSYSLFVGMNDSGGDQDFNYTKTAAVELRPGRNLVIQFDEEQREFLIR